MSWVAINNEADWRIYLEGYRIVGPFTDEAATSEWILNQLDFGDWIAVELDKPEDAERTLLRFV